MDILELVSIFTDEMIDAIAECPRVVKYIDIPLQHASDRMLKAMGRRVTRRKQEELLAKLRTRIPGLTIRTTFIVGFPGETEEDFEQTLSLAREVRFDQAFVFKYSPRRDTPAAAMPDHVSQAVKEERNQRLLDVVNESGARVD